MLSLLIAAAEPSRVPFYVAGAVLACWAVVVSTIGLTRPSFPYGAAGQRAVVVLSLLFAAAAIATAIVTDP